MKCGKCTRRIGDGPEDRLPGTHCLRCQVDAAKRIAELDQEAKTAVEKHVLAYEETLRLERELAKQKEVNIEEIAMELSTISVLRLFDALALVQILRGLPEESAGAHNIEIVNKVFKENETLRAVFTAADRCLWVKKDGTSDPVKSQSTSSEDWKCLGKAIYAARKAVAEEVNSKSEIKRQNVMKETGPYTVRRVSDGMVFKANLASAWYEEGMFYSRHKGDLVLVTEMRHCDGNLQFRMGKRFKVCNRCGGSYKGTAGEACPQGWWPPLSRGDKS